MEVATATSLLHPLLLRTKPKLLRNASASLRSSTVRLSEGASRVCIGRRWTSSAPLRQRYLLSKTYAVRGESEVPDVVDGKILAGSMVTVALAVANRVLYKLALVPMKQYPFFLAQVTTFGYVAVYFTILYVRYRVGIVTMGMLGVPKSQFMAIGLLEALGVAAGMAAGAQLPGPAIPILSQTFLVWQLIFSVLILGRRYSYNQVLGCSLVIAGVVLAVASGSSEGQFLSQIGFLWPALMVASSAFQAGASILKEFAFIDGARRLQGKPLDIFIVNSFGSGFQALFVFLLLPFLSHLRGIPFPELPTYLKDGAGCFFNVGHSKTGCEGAPLLPLLFIATNMAFNIFLLNLVKMSSALVSSLVVTLAVPMSIFILSLPLPYIPQGASLNFWFVIGTGILVVGLMLYNLPKLENQFDKSD
ncbi:protein CLT2, chloroplastic [Dioscorea cayenensis subsp. rotundata]|uniref:Protein CLT2, chloroplastic n=1 Tax=Dioscorea cayennensis subsp. rotundata TaxID=55577 RepID=A0AB40AH94_DIOCR|nr:protein CLT2, chloroplastic [Dioscorea cayenensis subsp. rotundata]